MHGLPDFFIADLPPEASLSEELLTEACRTLKHNREHFLAARSTESLIQVLCDVALEWLRPEYFLRRLALEHSPSLTGFEPATVERGIDSFFAWITEDNLWGLLAQELGVEYSLDDFQTSQGTAAASRSALACGPELLVHIAAGNLPNPAWTSMLLGALIRSSQFVKCASGTSFLPLLFAHSIYQRDAKLGSCIEIAEWPGGTSSWEDILFNQAGCVTVTGSDETLAAVRSKLPVTTRFAGYGHRISFGFVTARSMAGAALDKWAAAAAGDVAAWNQRGCLSPHVFYVENSQGGGAELFAEHLAGALAQREVHEPRGNIPVHEAALIANRRAAYEIRAAHLKDTCCWFSPGSTAWSVVFESDTRFQASCLNRFVYVKPATDLAEALAGAREIRHHVSTVGLAAAHSERKSLALQLARWGARRICPLGQMQNPPLSWRHDGRPALADWITWADFES